MSLGQVSGIVDAIGVEHPVIDLDASPRIVCLVPSITELLFALGLGKWLVGRTGFCIHPKEEVQALPKVGGTKDVNIEKIRRLAPTHLIVNIDENEKPTVDLLAEFVPHVIVTHPNHPRDNLSLFNFLGQIFRAEQAAKNLCDQLNEKLALFDHCHVQTSRTVLYCIWKDPWMTVRRDTYIAQMLALRGWKHWQSEANEKRYPSFDWHDPSLKQVDAILLSTEPYSFNQQHAERLQQELGKPVLLVDGEMLSWYGSRVIYGLEYLSTLNLET
jgi:ABC-type Fe3+-hydroxamate transport system substrate-binding protein